MDDGNRTLDDVFVEKEYSGTSAFSPDLFADGKTAKKGIYHARFDEPKEGSLDASGEGFNSSLSEAKNPLARINTPKSTAGTFTSSSRQENPLYSAEDIANRISLEKKPVTINVDGIRHGQGRPTALQRLKEELDEAIAQKELSQSFSAIGTDFAEQKAIWETIKELRGTLLDDLSPENQNLIKSINALIEEGALFSDEIVSVDMPLLEKWERKIENLKAKIQTIKEALKKAEEGAAAKSLLEQENLSLKQEFDAINQRYGKITGSQEYQDMCIGMAPGDKLDAIIYPLIDKLEWITDPTGKDFEKKKTETNIREEFAIINSHLDLVEEGIKKYQAEKVEEERKAQAEALELLKASQKIAEEFTRSKMAISNVMGALLYKAKKVKVDSLPDLEKREDGFTRAQDDFNLTPNNDTFAALEKALKEYNETVAILLEEAKTPKLQKHTDEDYRRMTRNIELKNKAIAYDDKTKTYTLKEKGSPDFRPMTQEEGEFYAGVIDALKEYKTFINQTDDVLDVLREQYMGLITAKKELLAGLNDWKGGAPSTCVVTPEWNPDTSSTIIKEDGEEEVDDEDNPGAKKWVKKYIQVPRDPVPPVTLKQLADNFTSELRAAEESLADSVRQELETLEAIKKNTVNEVKTVKIFKHMVLLLDRSGMWRTIDPAFEEDVTKALYVVTSYKGRMSTPQGSQEKINEIIQHLNHRRFKEARDAADEYNTLYKEATLRPQGEIATPESRLYTERRGWPSVIKKEKNGKWMLTNREGVAIELKDPLGWDTLHTNFQEENRRYFQFLQLSKSNAKEDLDRDLTAKNNAIVDAILSNKGLDNPFHLIDEFRKSLDDAFVTWKKTEEVIEKAKKSSLEDERKREVLEKRFVATNEKLSDLVAKRDSFLDEINSTLEKEMVGRLFSGLERRHGDIQKIIDEKRELTPALIELYEKEEAQARGALETIEKKINAIYGYDPNSTIPNETRKFQGVSLRSASSVPMEERVVLQPGGVRLTMEEWRAKKEREKLEKEAVARANPIDSQEEINEIRARQQLKESYLELYKNDPAAFREQLSKNPLVGMSTVHDEEKKRALGEALDQELGVKIEVLEEQLSQLIREVISLEGELLAKGVDVNSLADISVGSDRDTVGMIQKYEEILEQSEMLSKEIEEFKIQKKQQTDLWLTTAKNDRANDEKKAQKERLGIGANSTNQKNKQTFFTRLFKIKKGAESLPASEEPGILKGPHTESEVISDMAMFTDKRLEISEDNKIVPKPVPEPSAPEAPQPAAPTSPERATRVANLFKTLDPFMAKKFPGHEWVGYLIIAGAVAVGAATALKMATEKVPSRPSVTLGEAHRWTDLLQTPRIQQAYRDIKLQPDFIKFVQAQAPLVNLDSNNPSTIRSFSGMECEKLLKEPGVVYGLTLEQRTQVCDMLRNLENLAGATQADKNQSSYAVRHFTYADQSITTEKFYNDVRSLVEQADLADTRRKGRA